MSGKNLQQVPEEMAIQWLLIYLWVDQACLYVLDIFYLHFTLTFLKSNFSVTHRDNPPYFPLNFLLLSLLKHSKYKKRMKGIWNQQDQNKCEMFIPRHFLKFVLFKGEKEILQWYAM